MIISYNYQNYNYEAVIPAAGFGNRFLPATKLQLKGMLPVYDKSTIQYEVEETVASGIDDILIITGGVIGLLDTLLINQLD